MFLVLCNLKLVPPEKVALRRKRYVRCTMQLETVSKNLHPFT